eukprot:CAMPEP_0197474728 /NCGR_PEP_ID=MMETSP1309-20131121/6196_1 /TAXON_ID=464262 /ORGANISM="Genus nov. species nov., Strain RCC998" /LENGTH=310 /DNA_ID=CAMNT_0043014499 /DNA_START=103 /DNA_END=1036 /DNA_ORIENTATION=+
MAAADRIELCSGLKLGGLTPSVGLVKTVCQLLQRKVAEETGKDGRNRGVNVIKVMVMIRPRPGDFTYSPEEIRSMVMDIEAAASAGADGVVFGVLTTEGHVDVPAVRELVMKCKELSLDVTKYSPSLLRLLASPSSSSSSFLHHFPTLPFARTYILIGTGFFSLPFVVFPSFHRAFDLCKDLSEALNILCALGIGRVLTAGGEASVLEGKEKILQLVEQVEKNGMSISIMAGGGLTCDNAIQIVRETKCHEIHGSMKRVKKTAMTIKGDDKEAFGEWWVSDTETIAATSKRTLTLDELKDELKDYKRVVN